MAQDAARNNSQQLVGFFHELLELIHGFSGSFYRTRALKTCPKRGQEEFREEQRTFLCTSSGFDFAIRLCPGRESRFE
jgi:hypothetical protein